MSYPWTRQPLYMSKNTPQDYTVQLSLSIEFVVPIWLVRGLIVEQPKYPIPRTTLCRSSRQTRRRGLSVKGHGIRIEKQTLIESRCWYSSSTRCKLGQLTLTLMFPMALRPRTPKARRVLEPSQLHMFYTTIRSTILSTTPSSYTKPPRCRKSCASLSSNCPIRSWSSQLSKCTTRSPRTRRRYVQTMPLTRKPTAPLRLPSPDVHAYPPSRDCKHNTFGPCIAPLHVRTSHHPRPQKSNRPRAIICPLIRLPDGVTRSLRESC